MLLCFQVNVLTHCTDIRLSDWQCEQIRETNQRSASGCPDQTIEPVINNCPDKEQKSNEVYISFCGYICIYNYHRFCHMNEFIEGIVESYMLRFPTLQLPNQSFGPLEM